MSTPVRRKPNASTADLLVWSESPLPSDPLTPHPPPRSNQPSDGISKVVFGGLVTDEEFESLNKRKPCSGYKMKEMTGSGIFNQNGEDETEESSSVNLASNGKTGLRMYKQAISGISHISFGEEESISPKKPTTLAEFAKQRELSGNLDTEADANLQKQSSDAKWKELSGHDIFAPPPEILPRPTTARALALRENFEIKESDSRNVCTHPEDSNGAGDQGEEVTKTSKKINEKKYSELSGNNIFKEDSPPASAEKPLSTAKLREISGNNIFADGKAESRDYYGGVRRPPGGQSSIALV